MSTLRTGLRLGIRMIGRSPGFAAVAILTLALGIGANAAIFSVVDALLLEPLPYSQPGQLVAVWSTMASRGVPQSPSSPPDFRVWRERNHTFAGMAALYYLDLNLSIEGQEPRRLQTAAITPGLFPLLGVNPQLGRTFRSEESAYDRHHVVLLSDGLWARVFSRDPAAIGRTLDLDGHPFTIVGIMPHAMPFLSNVRQVDVWIPLAFSPGDVMNTRSNHFVTIVGRLRPDATLERAQADLSAIAAQLAQEFPENKGQGTLVVPLRDQLVGTYRAALWVLLGAVGLVLLIACANVANLFLARAASREREFSIRTALGASRRQLLAQLFAESLPLVAISAVAGVLIALWTVSLAVSILPADLPRFNPIEIDGRALAFTAALALATTVVFALVPAFRAAEANVSHALREAGRGVLDSARGRRVRAVLVVAEIALAFLLLVGAGLLIESFAGLQRVDPGFSPDHLLTMEVPLGPEHQTDEESARWLEEMLAQVGRLPDVRAAGVTSVLPLGFGNGWGKYFTVIGHTPVTSIDQVQSVMFALSSAGYLPAIGAHLHGGRFFSEDDRASSPQVAIVNEALVRQFFPGENPIGQEITMRPPSNLIPPDSRDSVQLAPVRRIVGVIADIKDARMGEPAQPKVYVPITQARNEGWMGTWPLVVRTTGDPLAAAASIQAEIRRLDPLQPVDQIAPMETLIGRSLSAPRFNTLLLAAFAALALLLAAIGIYGVMAYSVSQRRHEIGVRVALGADRQQVIMMVLRQGARLAVTGVCIGVVTSLVATRVIASLLYGVSASDPKTFAAVAVLLGLVALVACYVPARRAAGVDPLVALRQE
jgi:putative ABC transport system permease protein